jgi:hypothetical protein
LIGSDKLGGNFDEAQALLTYERRGDDKLQDYDETKTFQPLE